MGWIGSFNPRTPAGCDCQDSMIHSFTHPFQSTHPCGVRLRVVFQVWHLVEVSIHAPLRGATGAFFVHACPPFVSIHAPLRGATRRLQYIPNPRQVSIHAPLRGATFAGGFDLSLTFVSIHAPLRGATAVERTALSITPQFQSTHPCGVRRLAGR